MSIAFFYLFHRRASSSGFSHSVCCGLWTSSQASDPSWSLSLSPNGKYTIYFFSLTYFSFRTLVESIITLKRVPLYLYLPEYRGEINPHDFYDFLYTAWCTEAKHNPTLLILLILLFLFLHPVLSSSSFTYPSLSIMQVLHCPCRTIL